MTGESTATPSWEQFAEQTGAKPRIGCALCELPEDIKDNIHGAWAAKYRSTFIMRYLHNVGVDGVSQAMIDNHFKRRHEGVPA